MVVGIGGGGLQGLGLALELTRRGATVEVLEKQAQCLTQASTQNEGKIHLGFVFSNDTSFQTARLMVEGAYTFRPIVDSWLERPATWIVSRPFEYLVHRQSIVSPEDLEIRYRQILDAVRGAARTHGADSYFGADGGRRVRRLPEDELRGRFGNDAWAVFETGEIAIDPECLSRQIDDRVTADPRILVERNCTVLRARPGSDAIEVEVERDGIREIRRYDHFVNCTWEDLVRLDRTAGVEPVADWSYRIKHFVRVRGAGRLDVPSVTVVLGGFGDVVNYGEDYFLSWYPVGRRGFTTEAEVPAWPRTLVGDDAAQVRAGIREALTALVPAVTRLPAERVADSEVLGGIIYALGTREVNDPQSGLHERYEVGPRSFGRYHTIDTGKYTVAPLFARRMADRLVPER